MAAQGGRAFGRYRLLRPIASDAVSTTYYATSGPRRTARSGPADYAVRIAEHIDPDDEADVEAARQFISEAQEAAAISHPAAVRPVDVGVVDGRPYVVTPFVRAMPLRDMLTDGGKISEQAAMAMFAQLAAALDAAHRAGIVHGALSPCTIWVGPSVSEGLPYVAYLTGFGTGPLLRRHLAVAPPGPPVDDVLYVAPEQLRGEPLTDRCDQYALACAMYHTLERRPPFERPTRAKLYGAHLLAPAPLLEDTGDDAAARPARDALRRAMSKAPADRYPTCGDFVHDALPAGHDADGVSSASAGRGPGARQGWPALLRTWWPAAVVLVVAAIAVWWLAGPGQGAPPRAAAAGGQPRAAAPVDAQSPAAALRDDAGGDVVGRSRWSMPVTTEGVGQLAAVDGAVLAIDDEAITALEASNGAPRWKVYTGSTVGVAANAKVLAYAGRVLTRVDRITGEQLWAVDGVGPDRSLVADGMSVIGVGGDAEQPELMAVDAVDGTVRWRLQPALLGGSGDMVVAAARGRAYVLRGRRLGAVAVRGDRAEAELLWRKRPAEPWPVLAADGAGVVLADRRGRVCSRRSGTGEVAWCTAVPGVRRGQPQLAIADDRVVVASADAVVALDRSSGRQQWQVESPGVTHLAARSGRVVVSNGRGAQLIDLASGRMSTALADSQEVTALVLRDGGLFVAAGDDVTRFDLPDGE